MRCPYCGFYERRAIDSSKVTNSRPMERENAIKRRRQCRGCGKRFRTVERIADERDKTEIHISA